MQLKKMLRRSFAGGLAICGIFSTCTYGAEEFLYKNKVSKNQLIDLSGNKRNGIIKGKLLKGSNSLIFNGKDSGINVQNSSELNVNNGATYVAVVKFNNISNDPKDKKAHYAAVMYKHHQFVLALRGDKLYCNFHNGKKWGAYLFSPSSLRIKPDKWYHLALVFDYHNVSSHGEVWTTMKLFVDGVAVSGIQRDYIRPPNQDAPIQIGKADGFGDVWHLDGKIAEASMYSKTLSSAEVEKLVLKQKLAKPAFRMPIKVTEKQKNIIRQLKSIAPDKATSALVCMLESVLFIRDSGVNFEKAANKLKAAIVQGKNLAERLKLWNQNNDIQTIASNEAFLTFIYNNKKQKFIFVDMYDRKNSRSLFDSESNLWEIVITQKGKQVEFDSRSKGLTAKLLDMPERNGDDWNFKVRWNHPEFTVQSQFVFKKGRLEYDVKAESCSNSTIIKEVVFPSMNLKRLNHGKDILLVPMMSGVEMPFPVDKNTSYNHAYPSGHASMQLGAYYDKNSGVYFATEDPQAQSKMISLIPGNKKIAVKYIWKVGFAPGKKNSFNAKSNAAFELFHGNWYDAGLLYRNWLAKSGAPWWIKKLPRQDSPAWFMKNTLWFRFLGSSSDEKLVYKALKYFNMPVAVHWYGWDGPRDCDYPNGNFSPKSYELLQRLTSKGIKVVPYVNGRIWETRDSRDEDWRYTKYALPATVKSKNGMPIIELYDKYNVYAVMCPYTKLWQDEMLALTRRMAAFGSNGVYYDQVSAARPRFCYDKSHGHLLGDSNMWFMKGYFPMFNKIRKMLKAKYPDVALTAEDNAEPYITALDGSLPWRWMNEGQVPLFNMIYSGRTQFVGRSYYGGEWRAQFATFAHQLVNGEQLGWFTSRKLTSPFNMFRLFVKNGMYIRKAMLKYFNEGMLARSIDFKKTMKSFRLKWGTYGTKYVTAPEIVSSAWKYKNTIAYLMVNTTSQKLTQRISFDSLKRGVKAKQITINSFNTNGQTGREHKPAKFEENLVFEPYSVQLWIMSPKDEDVSKITNTLSETFKNIATFPGAPDPFASMLNATIPTPAKEWHNAYDAKVFTALRNSAKKCVTNISPHTFIYYGTVDFGNTPPEQFEAMFAVPKEYAGKKVTLYIDDIKTGKSIAKFHLKKFSDGWYDFVSYKAKAMREVTGEHKVFMKFSGGTACNVKKWRVNK